MSTLFYEANNSDALNKYLETHKLFIIADANTNGYCVPIAKKLLPALNSASIIVVPAGEQNKNLDVISYLWSQMMMQPINRNVLIVNIGGGVLMDMAGFACATFNRGVPFINIPTTLLAMVDASVGGKTGFNFQGIKNSIGAFALPKAIYTNPFFLNTLGVQYLKAGIVEMLKHALLTTYAQWHLLSKFNKMEDWLHVDLIKASIAIKNNIANQDLMDLGVRNKLNIGHSIGHAIEASTINNLKLSHGQAIFYGLIIEGLIANALFNIKNNYIADLLHCNKYFLSFEHLKFGEEILPYLFKDKKNTATINMSLLANVGDVRLQTPVTKELIITCLQTYNNNGW